MYDLNFFIYFIISALLITIGLFVFIKKSRTVKYYIKYNPQLPRFTYKLIYTDENTIKKKKGVTYGAILKSEKYDITGKPDYIYKKGKNYYPIELKSASLGKNKKPRKKDLMQLAVYFLIIEEVYGKTKKGKIIYKDAMVIVKNNNGLKSQIKQTLKEMREMLHTGEQQANPSYINCKNCVCKNTVCEWDT